MSQQTPLYIRGLTEKELVDLQSFAKERGYADRSAYCRQLLRDALQQEYVEHYAAPLEKSMQDQREAELKMLMAFRTYAETNNEAVASNGKLAEKVSRLLNILEE